MRIFAGEWVKGILTRLGMQRGEAIESRMVTRRIEAAQKKVEERNFSTRKHLLEWDEPMDYAAMEVREKLGLVELPREADLLSVLRFDPSLDPILRLSFSGDRSLDDLRQLADRWIKPRLEAVRGVAAAKVRGGLDPEITVDADEDRLAALGLTLDDLARRLAGIDGLEVTVAARLSQVLEVFSEEL